MVKKSYGLIVNIVVGVCVLATFNVAIAQVRSQPNDVKQFESSGICVSCDLSGDNIYCTKQSVAFSLVGSNLIRTHLSVSGEGHQNSNFSKVIGIELSARLADFSGSDFSGANLSGGDFYQDNFSHANFTGANLSGASMSYANLFGSNLTKEQLASLSSVCDAILPDGTKGKC